MITFVDTNVDFNIQFIEKINGSAGTSKRALDVFKTY